MMKKEASNSLRNRLKAANKKAPKIGKMERVKNPAKSRKLKMKKFLFHSKSN